MMHNIDPCELFQNDLALIEKPARYLGGEVSSIIKKEAALKIALCFPDLYEIAMANNAIKILYSRLNEKTDVSCERVFSVGLDYEALLRKKSVPLYCLETGLLVKETDILAFTIGYELTATNLLNILDLSGIPLLKKDRTEKDPIVIAGGPAITNPLMYSQILDAVWIGEAENKFFDLAELLAQKKKNGTTRTELLQIICQEPCVWIPGKNAIRNIYENFSSDDYDITFPFPSLKPVQDHGVVEIMRGCPNGCRFCHAGFFYRPKRVRNIDSIIKSVDKFVNVEGKKEISMSSLSSGDFPGITSLVQYLSERYQSKAVSFQLPSLKVETFPLDVLEVLAGKRKSGLTFAIETAREEWQNSVNKKVSFDKILEILNEAINLGYKVAKFYFMLGLPVPQNEQNEEDAIIELIRKMLTSTKSIKINVTLSIFIPKPHTPYQWAPQLQPEQAREKIFKIKDTFRQEGRVKISYHSPYLSKIESLLSRGDERVGKIILCAFKKGARFDAWDDKFNKQAWDETLEEYKDIVDEVLAEKSTQEVLPWHEISLRVGTKYYLAEKDKSNNSVLTSPCMKNCTHLCGACNDKLSVPEFKSLSISELKEKYPYKTENVVIDDDYINNAKDRKRLLFKFVKTKISAFYTHQDIRDLLFQAFEKSGIHFEFSQGFNPLPRFEISEPLSLGFMSNEEIGLAIVDRSSNFVWSDDYKHQALLTLKRFLPESLSITDMMQVMWPNQKKIPSLSKLHWGSKFELDFSNSSVDIDKVFDAFNSKKEIIPALNIEKENANLQIVLPFTGKRELGLSGIFSLTQSDIRSSKVKVTRLEQYASNDDKLVSYFSFFSDYQ